MRHILATLLLTVCGAATIGAAVKDLPVKRVNGKLYHYYEVPAHETVYALCYKLDIGKDEMLRHNPAVADGLRQGMTLFFPVDGDKAPAAQSIAGNGRGELAAGVVSHHVERGETIFGIANKYGITTEDVISQNPVLKNGLKAGQTITLTVPGHVTEPGARTVLEVTDAAAGPAAANGAPMRGYIVKKKETFYSIAAANGLSVAALEAANPGVSSLKEGQVLNIPVAAVANTAQDTATAADTDVGNRPNVAAMTSTQAAREVSVAVMLPFMLGEENPSKGALRYTEFYKGFLLAVDSLRTAAGVPVHVTAYDTEGSIIKVREALGSDAFKRHNIIIAPDNAPQLAVMAEWAKNNDAYVLNTFLVRDESYLANPAVIQGNLPSSQMYGRAVDALLQRMDRATPVFLAMKGERGDKADFVADLHSALDAKGKAYVDLEVDGRLTAEQLKRLDTNGNYFFIPCTSRQADINKMMPAIIEWRDDAITPLVRMFGYPEWTTFRGETLDNMHNIGTIVYSRFFTDEDSWRTRAVDAKYRSWYGGRMENAVPRQGLLGFDTGMFIIPYVAGGCSNAAGYDGVQNGYFLQQAPGEGAGMYNDALYFINFRRGDVEKSRI